MVNLDFDMCSVFSIYTQILKDGYLSTYYSPVGYKVLIIIPFTVVIIFLTCKIS